MLLWWLDRYEKEPLTLIAAAFLWGALPAIMLAIFFELILSAPIGQLPTKPGITEWGLAPLIEEPIKGLALIGLFQFARYEFDGPLDGIVYGALIGFGFSMTENLLYFLRYPDFDAVFWLRSVFFGLNHAFFTSMVGLSLGAVRYERSRERNIMSFLGGLVLAILFHALHNFAARYQFTGLLLSWLFQSGGVLVILAVAVLAWRHERHWMELELEEEVRNNVMTAEEYAEITSSPLRMRRQVAALMSGGWPHYRRTRRLHHLVTELAFRKSQERLQDHCHPADACDQLRREIQALRTTLRSKESAWGEL